MELFFSDSIIGGSSSIELNREESRHCIKVLRHKAGDIINVIDGSGSLFKCRIISSEDNHSKHNGKFPQAATGLSSFKEACKEHGQTKGKYRQSRNDSQDDCICCTIEEVLPYFGKHQYNLTMAVAPTKNMDRYEWFLEKGTETGLDEIVPVICEHSERKDLNTERCRRILVSAIKQSLKGALPILQEPVKFTDWLYATFPPGDSSSNDLRLICYCGDEFPKQSITQALTDFFQTGSNGKVTIIIGPEGDFSQAEIECAMQHGFKAITLGPSRLRVESAALLSVNAVYLQSL